MKENKPVRVFLAVALLCIWGLVGYKIYKKMNPGELAIVSPSSAMPARTMVAHIDSFSLFLDYPDPFFKKSFSSTNIAPATVLPKNKPAPKPTKPTKPIPFPKVVYKGTVRADRSAVLVSVNGKNRNMGVGEELEEVKLLKIYRDSIRVQFKEEERTIVKGQ